MGKLPIVLVLLVLYCSSGIQTLFAQEYQPDANTVLLLHMNEISGSTVADASSFGNNGTATGTTIVDGRFGKARNFNTTSDEVRIGNPFSGVNDNFTIEAWVNVNLLNSNSANSSNTIFRNRQNVYDVYLVLANDGRVHTDIHNNTQSNELYSKIVLDLHKWYHLAFSYDGQTQRLFVNGVLDTSRLIGPLNHNWTQNYIGTSIGNNTFDGSLWAFNGMIDEVRISSKARSPNEFNLQLPPMNVSAAASRITINLNWQNGGGASSLLRYKIYRGVDSTNVSLIDSTTSTSYSNANLIAVARYFYRISAVDSTGFEGAKSYAVSATTSYIENFSSSPSFSYATIPSAGDSYTWDTALGIYKVFLTETVSSVNKFALSPQFNKVNNSDFVIQVDLKPVAVSFGMGIGIRFYDADVGLDNAIEIHHTGSDNPLFAISDGRGQIYRTTAPDSGTWYTVRISYAKSTGRADLSITNTATGQVLYQQNAISFNPGGFNRVAFGATTGGGDGTTAEMHYDNVSVNATISGTPTISLTSGNNQSGRISTTLSSPFVVTVTDANGVPLEGSSVTFALASVPSGATGQSLSTTSATTNSNGQASSVLTLGNKSGVYTVTASSSGLTGSPVTFTATAFDAPTATTISVLNVSSSSATLIGFVNPNGLPTTVYFEWGTNPLLFFNTTTSQSIGSGTSTVSVFWNLAGLSIGTYYYRVVGQNSAGISRGSILSFTTLASAPSAPTLVSPADGVTGVSTNPTLSWNAVSGATSYSIQVSTSSGFSTFVVNQSGITSTSHTASGLSNNTLYYWRVNATNAGGTGPFSSTYSFRTIVTLSVEQIGNDLPKDYSLSQNYPNPFNPLTIIRFSIPREVHVRLTALDIRGKTVVQLVNETKSAGTYEVRWDGKDSFGNSVATGAYFYRLETPGYKTTKKMLLVK